MGGWDSHMYIEASPAIRWLLNRVFYSYALTRMCLEQSALTQGAQIYYGYRHPCSTEWFMTGIWTTI